MKNKKSSKSTNNSVNANKNKIPNANNIQVNKPESVSQGNVTSVPSRGDKQNKTTSNLNPVPRNRVLKPDTTRANSHTDQHLCDAINIGTLNVCGLKTRSQYPIFIELINKYDIFCVNETKLDIYDDISIPNYTFLSKVRKQEYLRKSGGIGIFVNNNLFKQVEIIESESEYILWLKIKKCLNNDDLILGVFYVPPQSSRFYNDHDFSCFESEITNMCCIYPNVALTGDANAHTSQLPDYIIEDQFLADHFDFDQTTIDFFNKTNLLLKNDMNLNRISKDKKSNSIGNTLLDICKNNNIFILNGRSGKDKGLGNFTFRNTSAIDYTTVSSNCTNCISNFEIRDLDPLFSDGHALLSVTISLNMRKQAPSESQIKVDKPPKWDETRKNNFVENIDREQIIIIQYLLDNFSNNDAKLQINNITNKIGELFINSAKKTFPEKNSYPRNPNNKQWYGPKCHNSRKRYNKARKKYNINKCELNKRELNDASKQYKVTMNTYINKHKSQNERKLRNLSKKTSKRLLEIP